MPGIDQILETILSTARQEADSTLSDARNRCEMIRRQAEADVVAFGESMEKTTRSHREEIERRADTQARLGRSREKLAVRQALIGEAFEQALDALCALPAERFVPFVEGLMQEAAVTGHERVITAPHETRIDAALIARVNRALAAQGLPGSLTLSDEKAPIRGGFLLEEDGVLTNCSFEMLLRQLRTGIEAEVAETLFPGGEV
ncbi:MAG: V-type ATP synthase subunit E [Christensenellales bacterium]|jgi:V/A-type H+-transporting ATPase subunit E